MYMGVILRINRSMSTMTCAPHVYGGDPQDLRLRPKLAKVLPMYMGVIPYRSLWACWNFSAPHVYGGDPGTPEVLH